MKSVLQDQIASVPLTWDVEIENDNSHPELNSINVSGDAERKVDGNTILLRTSMRSRFNETGQPFLTVLLNGKSLQHAPPTAATSPRTPPRLPWTRWRRNSRKGSR